MYDAKTCFALWREQSIELDQIHLEVILAHKTLHTDFRCPSLKTATHNLAPTLDMASQWCTSCGPEFMNLPSVAAMGHSYEMLDALTELTAAHLLLNQPVPAGPSRYGSRVQDLVRAEDHIRATLNSEASPNVHAWSQLLIEQISDARRTHQSWLRQDNQTALMTAHRQPKAIDPPGQYVVVVGRSWGSSIVRAHDLELAYPPGVYLFDHVLTNLLRSAHMIASISRHDPLDGPEVIESTDALVRDNPELPLNDALDISRSL